MELNHPKLVKLLQKAYSAEKAAAYAYIGHAGSIKDPKTKAEVKMMNWNTERKFLQS